MLYCNTNSMEILIGYHTKSGEILLMEWVPSANLTDIICIII